MLAAFCWMRLDFVTICEDWLGGFTRFFVRPARSIILAVFMVALSRSRRRSRPNPCAAER